jgi:hypothetical protein
MALALALTPTARADSFSTGGAIARVDALDRWSVQSGSTPAAIDQTGVIHFTDYDANSQPSPGSVTATVNTSASASDTPAAGSLQLHLAFSAPSPGNYSGGTDPTAVVSAFADWPNFTTTVQAPAGRPMPGSIRLEFQANYTPPPADWNHENSRISVMLPSSTPMVMFGYPGSPMQAGETTPVQVQPDGTLTGTFHVDVPLPPSGVSTVPFSMLLQDWMSGLPRNAAVSVDDVASVALNGMYGPDGSSLTAEGYMVSFQTAPGLLQFTPTPEPATWAAWGVIATVGALMLRRHRTRT